jgi:hypothetical protein
LAIASLLIACGGGGGGEQAPAPGGGGGSTSAPPGGGGGVIGCSSGAVPAVLTWDAVTAPSPAAGYRIYYGTAPGTYLQASGVGVDVSNVTTFTVTTGLNSGTTYYFAAKAYDTSIPPNESVFSNEVCKTIS